jgi:predicted small lipoprotein YifL
MIRAALLLTALLAPLSGCGLKAAAYFLSPPQVKEAEFEFPERAQVALVLDPARPQFEHPVFERALYDRLVEIFREKKSTAELIAPREAMSLKRQHADFGSWSVQKIGRELGATHVLYVRVAELQSRESSAHPVLNPRAELRVKVISVERPPESARVWPIEEKDGRTFSSSRQIEESADSTAEDSAMTKLARDIGWLVASPFFKLDLEEKPPQER